MRKNKLILDVIEVPLDFVLLILSGILAYYLRFAQMVVQYRPVIFDLPFFLFFKILIIVSFVALIVFMFSGLYNFEKRNLQSKVSKVFVACSTFILILIVAFFFNQRLFSSRFIVLFYWAFSIFFMLIERIILNIIRKILIKKGVIQSKVVIINKEDSQLINEFRKNKSLGFNIIKTYNTLDNSTIEDLKILLNNSNIDEVILLDPYADRAMVNNLVNICNIHHVVYKYAASLLDTKIINFEIDTIAGVPIIEIKGTLLDGWGRIWKRVLDILLSLVGFVFFIPIYIIVGIIINLDTKGPILVRLTRVGAKNKEFKMYKFRSMVVGADKMKNDLMKYNERGDGPLFKMKDDPRITCVGKVLRKTSIDEIPQLVNVFLGEMSIVGPRAHEPREVAEYEDNHMKLLAIKPGITGMAQVSGRSELKFDEEVRLDIYYIENWSLWLDIKIILKTIKVVLFDKNAV
ncbi:MAG: sugar transferase [Patescibacteria group bacterium]|nr:sugar transferase [Patescibacteria group bacterium]MDD4304445.1 sugar transferase [Patescibacteria group bacterium]MDD4695468.1 sugar transferase [Patescibacteria group bacterium]